MRLRHTLPALVALLAAAVPLPGGAQAVRAPHIEAELVAESAVLGPGENWVALRLKPDRGWHTYWRNPGDSGLPTELDWVLPEGVRAGAIHWPHPEIHRLGELVNYGYGRETLHLVPLQVPAAFVGRSLEIQAEARWLVCEDICIPGQAQLRLERPVGPTPQADPRWRAAFDQARSRLPRPEAVRGEFEVTEQEVRFALQLPAGNTGGSAHFFPYPGDLIDHSAPQRSERAEGGLRLAQARSPLYRAAPEAVRGVLVIEGAQAPAYEAVLSPGTVAPVTAAPQAAPEGAPGLALILGLAFIGGLILNLMPCVFPVLSIKAVSLMESRLAHPGQQRWHALAYTLGVVLSCVTAALVILALRAGGEILGWGFQLQSPVFVAVLAYVLFVLGLSLSGLLQIGTSVMGVGQSLTVQRGYAGSFFTGVLAVVVASPCTVPFMATALGYALTQPALPAVAIFISLGLGLAAPFLLIGFVPRLGALLPRPGPWMETFKQFMAFPLYLTVVWLVWVLGRQSDINAAALVLLGLVLIAFAAWLQPRGRWLQRGLRAAALLAALAVLAHPVVTPRDPSQAPATAAGSAWEPYSDERLAALRGAGRAVFVNLTADWCITCKVNERVALDSERVMGAFAARDVALLKGDWTNSDPAITRVLERFQHPGVPLYLLYPPSGEPRVLPQILTPDVVVGALDELP